MLETDEDEMKFIDSPALGNFAMPQHRPLLKRIPQPYVRLIQKQQQTMIREGVDVAGPFDFPGKMVGEGFLGVHGHG